MVLDIYQDNVANYCRNRSNAAQQQGRSTLHGEIKAAANRLLLACHGAPLGKLDNAFHATLLKSHIFHESGTIPGCVGAAPSEWDLAHEPCE
ncbi:hypothetical protein [Janthinobacterium agaricidamnosum]|uniref:hypothetical protein n=1 Tax=Janthinobacterium agaricidamnosum TaxID=55508 RepID=UPI001185D342|nr:hypothetical protein [Janthinobacterium agaricidamnosum]